MKFSMAIPLATLVTFFVSCSSIQKTNIDDTIFPIISSLDSLNFYFDGNLVPLEKSHFENYYLNKKNGFDSVAKRMKAAYEKEKEDENPDPYANRNMPAQVMKRMPQFNAYAGIGLDKQYAERYYDGEIGDKRHQYLMTVAVERQTHNVSITIRHENKQTGYYY